MALVVAPVSSRKLKVVAVADADFDHNEVAIYYIHGQCVGVEFALRLCVRERTVPEQKEDRDQRSPEFSACP